MKVELFVPCFVDQVYPETAFNMVKVLEALGCTLSYNTAQTCCGQPAYNAGHFDEARQVARKFLREFQDEEAYMVGPSASCVGMVRNGYHSLVKDNPEDLALYQRLAERSFEFTEFLTDVLQVESIPGACFKGRATYHDSCSALRECKIKEGPRRLLAHVQDLEMVEMEGTENCCGFGGTFAVKFEPISVGMGEMKVENALATDAQYLISTDSSCLLHLQGYIDHKKLPLKTYHIADILASGW